MLVRQQHLLLFYSAYLIYCITTSNLPKSAFAKIVLVCFILYSTIFSIFYFLKTLKTVTVTKENIIVDFLILKKQLLIYFADIKWLSTTRDPGDGGIYGSLNYQNFTIELYNGSSIVFNAGDYENYHHLKSVIYQNKLRPATN